MPHWPGPGEFARSKRATTEPFPSVIWLCKVAKICQKRVNTRQNGLTRRPVRFAHQSHAHAHSTVPSSSFLRCAFSRRDVFPECSQLLHNRFSASLAPRLVTRKPVRKRTEKNQI